MSTSVVDKESGRSMVLDRKVAASKVHFLVTDAGIRHSDIYHSGDLALDLGPGPWPRPAWIVDAGPAGMLFEHSGGIRETFLGSWFNTTAAIATDLRIDLRGLHGTLWFGGPESRWTPSDPPEGWKEIEDVRIVREIMSL